MFFESEEPMKDSICLLLLLSTSLFTACTGSTPTGITPVTIPISVDSSNSATCKTPYAWQDVPQGGQVSWSSDGPVYEIDFLGKDPVHSPATSGVTYTAKGGLLCNILSFGCCYKYTIKKNGAQCADPGVHIVPDGRPLKSGTQCP